MKTALLSLLIFASVAEAREPKWKKVSKANDGIMAFVDTSSIKHWTYSKTNRTGASFWVKFSASYEEVEDRRVEFWDAFCDTEEVTIKQKTEFSGGKSKRSTGIEYFTAIPGTIASLIVSFACK